MSRQTPRVKTTPNPREALLNPKTLKSVEAVRQAIAAGADLDAPNSLGRTPLIRAIFEDRTEVAEVLIDAGADIRVLDKVGRTALHYAACADKGVPVVKKIIGLGIDPNNPSAKRNGAPLLTAASCGNLAGVKALVEAGADPRKCDYRGRTAPHFICGGEKLKAAKETVDALVEAGADVEAGDNNGDTPLHFATRTGNIILAEWLIDRGARIDVHSESGSTPLHHAIIGKNIEMGRMLLSRGADLYIRD